MHCHAIDTILSNLQGTVPVIQTADMADHRLATVCWLPINAK